jgi:hypothetical protein
MAYIYLIHQNVYFYFINVLGIEVSSLYARSRLACNSTTLLVTQTSSNPKAVVKYQIQHTGYAMQYLQTIEEEAVSLPTVAASWPMEDAQEVNCD